MRRYPIVLAAIVLVLSGCAHRNELDSDFGPEVLYDRGKNAMDAGNYPGAIQFFLQLESRFPFSNATRQAQLDMIYAYYMSNQPESAIDAIDEFQRENPTHERIDYCLYMKGRIYFDQSPNVLERWFNVDLARRPPKDTMESFSAFQELLRRFPDSRYAEDARKRMVFLRNRLAEYENYVAAFYIRRGAYVAAAHRAKYAIEHYPEAPQLERSMNLLIEAYQKLGMDDLAADAARVLEQTYGDDPARATADLRN